ncbi:MAG TPA: hypothetical protein VMT18_13040 [Planctomycetota bacterium]|nr:hypothetical protein [Planctomycetota bacterium]
MDAASALPVFPHIKTQAELQQNVVEACIELDQPRQALEYTRGIGNWRRGVGYADLAGWLAEGAMEPGFEELVALAEQESRLEGEENPQDWQRDLIRSKLAVALFEVGRAGDAAQFEVDLEDSEVGRVAAAKAGLLDRDELEARLGELDELVHAATFDQLVSALEAAVQLYQRGFDDVDLRARCDAWIERASRKLPAQIRLETRLDLVRVAAALGDDVEARSQVDHARAVLDGASWLPEDRVPLTARVAAARFVAGDEQTARVEATEALDLFHEGRETIQDFWRGEALRPLAEAYATMGAEADALRVYRIAAEESTSNANARPRCEDLVATCLSMALHDVQPDAELRARLLATREGLEDPW